MLVLCVDGTHPQPIPFFPFNFIFSSQLPLHTYPLVSRLTISSVLNFSSILHVFVPSLFRPFNFPSLSPFLLIFLSPFFQTPIFCHPLLSLLPVFFPLSPPFLHAIFLASQSHFPSLFFQTYLPSLYPLISSFHLRFLPSNSTKVCLLLRTLLAPSFSPSSHPPFLPSWPHPQQHPDLIVPSLKICTLHLLFL